VSERRPSAPCRRELGDEHRRRSGAGESLGGTRALAEKL
jgi:hypothetical protein